jgi:hypothetical protein
VNLLGDNIDTIHKRTKTLIDASKDIDLEINVENTKQFFSISSPECTLKSGHKNSKEIV